MILQRHLRMKYLHAIMTVLFVVTAVLQINDPDPLYWVATYLAVAVIGGTAFFNRPLMTLCKVVIGMAVAGILISVPGTGDYFTSQDYGSITQSMRGDKPYIEEAREFGGLFVALAYLVFFEIMHRRTNR